MKSVRLKLSPEAEEVYKHLNEQAPTSKTERMILKAINQKVELIKSNPHFGNPISKNKIPLEYQQKYGITNLFRVELPSSLSKKYRILFFYCKEKIILKSRNIYKQIFM